MSIFLFQQQMLSNSTFTLVFIEVFFLIYSLLKAIKIYKILELNKVKSIKFLVIIALIILIILAFLFSIFNYTKLPISANLILSAICFFVTVLVFISMQYIHSIVKSIYGGIISNKEAINLFLKRVDIKKTSLIHLNDNFLINCKHCESEISYNIASIVRQHLSLKNKGIEVEAVFGVKSFYLYNNHNCNGDLREIITLHDNSLAFRSIDRTRIIINLTNE